MLSVQAAEAAGLCPWLTCDEGLWQLVARLILPVVCVCEVPQQDEQLRVRCNQALERLTRVVRLAGVCRVCVWGGEVGVSRVELISS
jgi:hypothetical protein